MSDIFGIGSGNSGASFNNYLGTSSSGSGVNLGDYGLIQSGAYRKLLNSYYGTKKSTSSAPVKDSEEVKTIKKNLTQVKSAGQSLSDVAKELVNLKEEAFEDKEGLSKKVDSYVKAYNDLIESVGESDTRSVLHKTLGMIGSTNTNARLLSNIGITIGTDNKLSFDAETFKTAETSVMKTLFGSNTSFIGRVAGKSSELVNLSNNAINAASKTNTYSNKGDFKSVDTSTLYDDLV